MVLRIMYDGLKKGTWIWLSPHIFPIFLVFLNASGLSACTIEKIPIAFYLQENSNNTNQRENSK